MRSNAQKAVVVTGLGVVSPIGVGVDAFWKAATSGVSGTGDITAFETKHLPSPCRIAGEVRAFHPEEWVAARLAKGAGRFSQFAVAGAAMAVNDSGLDRADIPRERLIASIGTSMSGLVDVALPDFEAFQAGHDLLPSTAREYSGQAATAHVARLVGAVGAWNTFSGACAAGLDAIAWAAERIATGEAMAAVAGATDTPLSPSTLESFRASGLLSQWTGPPSEASRPFDRSHSGLVVAEGAGVLVLEDEDCAQARGASSYARVLGFGTASEGASGKTLDRNADCTARSITIALARAGLQPSDIDFVSAHGNSIPEHDAAETIGLRHALGKHVYNTPVSSLKSMCGQAFAAAGAIQVVASCLAIRHQTVTPTINHDEPAISCDLDYVPWIARTARIRHVLIHVRSIGGSHNCMILGNI